MIEFNGFGKIARLSRKVIVTEKIDGTNAQIFVEALEGYPSVDPMCIYQSEGMAIYAGSRSRWITPLTDNHGFARWVLDHAEELMLLGIGRHFGEWWGSGINRGYGLPKGEKRFSLFNTVRWCLSGKEPQQISADEKGNVKMQCVLPACCSLVPVLWDGIFDIVQIDGVLSDLARQGSRAAPGYTNPEGVVIYHVAGNVCFKKTLGDDGHKGG